MNKSLTNFLFDFVGEKVISVLGLFYLLEGEKDIDDPQELQINFSSGRSLKIYCSPDGASICCESGYIVARNLGDFGEEIVEDVSYMTPWENLVGDQIIDVCVAKSSIEKASIGIRLGFGKENVSVLNLGDDLYVFEDVPETIVRDQGLEFDCSV